MCLRYDFRNQNSARIGINLLPNVIKLFSDRTCIFHARSFLPLSGQRRPDDVLASLIAPHFDFLLLLRYLILLILIEIYAAGRNVSSCCHYISHSCCCRRCCWHCWCSHCQRHTAAMVIHRRAIECDSRFAPPTSSAAMKNRRR